MSRFDLRKPYARVAGMPSPPGIETIAVVELREIVKTKRIDGPNPGVMIRDPGFQLEPHDLFREAVSSTGILVTGVRLHE